MHNTKVVLKHCKEYSSKQIASCLDEGFKLLGGLDNIIKPNQTVLIKPDLYYSTLPSDAKTTHPSIITALADLIYQIGAKCIIADSPKGEFKQSNLDRVYEKTGMLKSSNNGHATLNTNEDITIINNPNGEHSRDIYVIDAVNDADVIINVGKLRCDKNLGLIGCGQNLFGLIPGKFKQLVTTRCYTLKSYYNYNIDLYEALEDKVVLNILDAIVSNEANNDPRILNSIIISQNPYSVDSVALRLINQQPNENVLLQESVRRGKFDFNAELVGDKLEPYVCSDFHYTQFTENIKNASINSFIREYNSHQKRPLISSSQCKGCKICMNNCPMKAISMQNSALGEYAEVDYNKCINCLKCVDNCPYKVIKTKTPAKYKPIDKTLKKSLHNKQ